MSEDERFMQLALELANMGRGQTSPNPLVGAVVVKHGQIVGQGAHLKAGGPHAEVHALRMAGEQAKNATIYVTLEPCNHTGRTPPCTDALIAAGIGRVVVAAGDPNPTVNGSGLRRLRNAGIEVTTGVLEAEAVAQNEAYFTWRRLGRAFVHWKCATTLDGYIAASSGHSQYVTGKSARFEVQRLRSQYPAIGVGSGTVLTDDPRLTIRNPQDESVDDESQQPLRVVFDTRFRVPADARMLREPGCTWVYTTERALRERQQSDAPFPKATNFEAVVVGETDSGHLNLHQVLVNLAERGYHSVLMEGGSTLMQSFLAQELVDKVTFFVAPKLLGGGIPVLRPSQTSNMEAAVVFDRVSWRTIGDDLCFEGYPIYASGSTDQG